MDHMAKRHPLALLFRCLNCLPWLLFPVIGMAQQPIPDAGASSTATPPEALAEAAEPPVEPLEEITVVGEQTFISLRHQIERAEDSLYRLFNELNSDDSFDIICRRIEYTRSHIPRRSCEPVFLTERRRNSSMFAQSEMRQAFSEDGIDTAVLIRGMDFLESEKELQEQAEGDFEALNEEIFRIAAEHPDYLDALLRVGQLKSTLEEARQKKFGSGSKPD